MLIDLDDHYDDETIACDSRQFENFTCWITLIHVTNVTNCLSSSTEGFGALHLSY